MANPAHLPDDQQQREDALDLSTSAVVMAPAGSGKTELLTQRALACLTTCRRPEEVIALTFTNKATAEMKARILGALVQAKTEPVPEDAHGATTWRLARKVIERDEEFGWALTENPSRLRFTTMDALNATLAAQLPLLSGLGGAARIDEHPQLLYESAVHALIAELDNPNAPSEVREAVAALLGFAGNQTERLIPQLMALLGCRDQWGYALYEADPLRMEEALSNLVHDRLTLAVSVLADCGGQALPKILAAGAGQEPLAAFAGMATLPDPTPDQLGAWRQLTAVLLTKAGTLRARVDRRTGFPAKADHTVAMKEWLEAVRESGQAELLGRVLADVRDLPVPEYPEDMALFRKHLMVALVHLMGCLRLVFERTGRLDFIEVALRALHSLGDTDHVSDVLLRMDYAVRHILVDEMQDTSLSQIRLLERLTAGWEAGDGRTLFMVGDPQQSIYLFRQAEVRLFMQLWSEQHFHDIPLRCLRLTTNFRSEPAVVEWFNGALGRIFPPDGDLTTGAVTFSPSTPFKPQNEGSVAVHPFIGADDKAEAERVVQVIREAKKTDPEGSIAVLVRARSHLREIIPALTAAGIRYTATDIDPLAKRTAVRDVIHLIRALRHPMDRMAWLGLMRARFVGLCWADLLAVARASGQDGSLLEGLEEAIATRRLSRDGEARARQLAGVLEAIRTDPSQAGWFPRAVRGVWYALGGHEVITPEEEADIETLFTRLDTHCPTGEVEDMRAFMTALDGLFATPDAGGVELMTIHKAKGLQFDTVIIPGLGRKGRGEDPQIMHYHALPEGFVIAPHPGRGADPETEASRLFRTIGELKRQSLENEVLRLLYVGLTRAKSRMHLLGHAQTTSNDRVTPPGGSLLAYLWPAVEKEYEAAAAESLDAAESIGSGGSAERGPRHWIPVIERRPADLPVSIPGPVFVPRQERTALPSELAASGAEDSHGGEGGADVLDRAVGTVYHALVERIANEGLDEWPVTRLQTIGRAIDVRLHQLGVPGRVFQAARHRIVSLVRKTLECDHGQWLLGHPMARAEVKLAGYLDGRWEVGEIDLVLDEEDFLLVVDHKTGGDGLKGQHLERWLAHQVQRYQPQLRRYAALLRGRGETRPIHGALYFPAAQRLLQVDLEETEAEEAGAA